MMRPSNVHDPSGTVRPAGTHGGFWMRRAVVLPAIALALVLAGCSSQDQPGSAARSDSPSPAPENSAPAAGTNAPSSGAPDKADLFRAEDPVSVETYFETEPQLRPENGSVLLEESAAGPSTFELPAMEPGTTFKTFLTCRGI
ncbi:hypothetical protein ABIB35_000680 [Arthrobacter sp. UYP6]